MAEERNSLDKAHSLPACQPLQGNSRYEQVRYISRGGFGSVVLAQDTATGRQVALKYLARGEKITKYVLTEILNHLRLQHPHIIELLEVFLTAEHLVLVLEYAAGGDLMGRVKSRGGLPEEEARWFAQQALFSLDYMHKMGMANRDIKLENVLVMDDSAWPLIKLADFGFSKDENNQSAPDSRVGTPAYLAPEIIMNVEGNTYDAKQADVWSAGVMLFVMLTGHYPFCRPEEDLLPVAVKLQHMIQRILKSSLDFPAHAALSDTCKDLITRMLVPDPTRRLTVHQVLHHTWMTQGLDSTVTSFNDRIVAHALANAPSQDVLDAIKSIVQEAASSSHAEGGVESGLHDLGAEAEVEYESDMGMGSLEDLDLESGE